MEKRAIQPDNMRMASFIVKQANSKGSFKTIIRYNRQKPNEASHSNTQTERKPKIEDLM